MNTIELDTILRSLEFICFMLNEFEYNPQEQWTPRLATRFELAITWTGNSNKDFGVAAVYWHNDLKSYTSLSLLHYFLNTHES